MSDETIAFTQECVHVSNVYQMLTDAFKGMIASRSVESSRPKDWEARTSILHAALSIEHLANNCLNSLGLSKKLYESIEALSTLDKLEFFLWQRQNGQRFDRGCHAVQCATEIVGLRNAYVHPKVRQHSDATWPHLRISKSPSDWGSRDAETVFRSTIEFYRTFIFEWNKLTRAEIAWLLGTAMTTKEGYSFLLFRTAERQPLLEMSQFLEDDLGFLGINKSDTAPATDAGPLTIEVSDEELARIREVQERD